MDPAAPLELSPLAPPPPGAEDSEAEAAPPAGPDPAPPPEKNGLVPKLPPDEEAAGGGSVSGGPPPAFAGLGKEEVLRAAAAPPWAKARALLLLLFWLGWLGMLGAAAAIVARAPRCAPPRGPPAPPPAMGGLYRAPPGPFGGDLRGVAARLEHVAGLGVRGLVLGPLHPQTPGAPRNLAQLDPALGSLEDFAHLVQAAREKELEVIVDLTPNGGGTPAWLGPEVAADPEFHEEVERALGAWLERGADGVFLDGIEELEPAVVAEWRNLTEQHNGTRGGPRVLVGGTRLRDPPALAALLNASGAGLMLGPFLEALGPAPPGPALAPQLLAFLRPDTALAWSVGSPWQHSLGLSPALAPQRLLLLWALPGSPALSYGDEVGLAPPPGGAQPPPMPWEMIDSIREGDNSTEAELLGLCRRLGALRRRWRSLAEGEAEAVAAEPAGAFLRSQAGEEGFVVVVNPGGQPLPRLALRHPRLPPRATLRLSTHRPLPPDPHLDLGALELLPYEGLLLSFPPAP